jgi:flagellar hook assembly protein FlgD
LRQNAPNPFNPATTIKFELPKASDVRLDVYNILGQKIRTLVDRYLPAGIYRVTFDGRGDDDQPLASGVYLYRLKAGDYAESKVMVMVK